MKKFLFHTIIATVLAGCGEQYPDNYTKDLPFGLSYYESKSESEEKLKPLVDNKILEPPTTYDSHYHYTMNTKDGEKVNLSVELRYENDSLYCVDVRDEYHGFGLKPKENRKNAISFFKEQEIGLNLYTKTTVLGNTKWNNGKYEISLYTDPNLIIVFEDDFISERLFRKHMEKYRKKIKITDKDTFCRSIIDAGSGLYAATVTDSKFLVIGVRPIYFGNDKPNFDVLAETYLERATEAGLRIKGCFVVDYDKSKFQDGAVVGERIGQAYKK